MSDIYSGINNKLMLFLIGVLISLGAWIGTNLHTSVGVMEDSVHQIDKRIVSMESSIIKKDDVLERLTDLTIQVKEQENKIYKMMQGIVREHDERHKDET